MPGYNPRPPRGAGCIGEIRARSLARFPGDLLPVPGLDAPEGTEGARVDLDSEQVRLVDQRERPLVERDRRNGPRHDRVSRVPEHRALGGVELALALLHQLRHLPAAVAQVIGLTAAAPDVVVAARVTVRADPREVGDVVIRLRHVLAEEDVRGPRSGDELD